MKENSELITILTEVDEGTKTPFKAYNEILFLYGVSGSNWFEQLPLYKRYLIYWLTGIALGLVISTFFI